MSNDDDQLGPEGMAGPEAVAGEVKALSAPRLFTDRDRAILEFERLVWGYAGAKEAAVRERFDMSMTRYSQVVMWLLDHPDAEAYDPTTVRRLRRIRDERARGRRGQVRAENLPARAPLTRDPQLGIRPRHQFR